MIALGARPAPNLHVQATNKVTFAKAFLSVSNIIFAYAGHVAFFSFISELKDPKTFPRALFVLQGTDTLMYIIVGVVVYRYAGADVKSPALGSTGSKVSKVAYGIALPTVRFSEILYINFVSLILMGPRYS
jgi:amino acid permease